MEYSIYLSARMDSGFTPQLIHHRSSGVRFHHPSSMAANHSPCIHLLTVLIIHSLLAAASSTATTNITTDQSSLLALKAHVISDPSGVLKNWTIPSSVCNWIGVSCGQRHHRVTKLNISNLGLSGTIPPHLGNLSFLVSIDLKTNAFAGALPKDLIRLRRLRFIELSQNNFVGEFPSWFSSFPHLDKLYIQNNSFTSLDSFLLSSTNESKLATLDVSFNPFQGQIPKSIGNLQNLKRLAMISNGFSGFIPPSITNISSLETLKLGGNSVQGPIPPAIFNMSRLKVVNMVSNNLSGSLSNKGCIGVPVLRSLSLNDNLISGQIPSNLSRCSGLEFLSLSYNSFSGIIPQEIGSMKMLQVLYLGRNKLSGPIPAAMGQLENLQELALERNSLAGPIPLPIFNISVLQVLSLHRNQLTGFLTTNIGIGNLTKLKMLHLGQNNFKGVIPQVFDKLRELVKVQFPENRLSGPLPSSMFNVSTVREISLAVNSFSGNLPTDIGTFLPSLQGLYLGANNLDGVLPSSISNASQLKDLDLASNKLTGPIPNSLGDLKFLTNLMLENNSFSLEPASSDQCSFITSLTSSKFLTKLTVSGNPLKGTLPISVGNLSTTIFTFQASGCQLKGYIPNGIGNLSGLGRLYLDQIQLTGVIPSALNKLSNLQELILGNNQLTGSIPNGLCKLKKLGSMSFRYNQLYGSIPECLGNLSSIRCMQLNSNNLSSSIPTSIWRMQDLLELDISSNSITGSLSSEIGNLKAVLSINLSMNKFSNDIPNTLGGLQTVSYLSLAHNRFQGPIPDSMGKMLSLNSLDLSHNLLSGTIPKSLESLTHLESLNVSFNKLSGEIPSNGPFKNLTSQSFAFNTALCGPPRFQVPPCEESLHRSKKKKIFQGAFIALGIGALIFIFTVAILIGQYRRKKKAPTVPDVANIARPERMSYYDLLKATNGCSEGNLLGRGSFGSVYKGVVEDGTILAIKVFNLLLEVASKTFEAECDALRNLRHRNLIKVVSSCSNEDFKAIVLEYMPNGSLEKWLYSDNHFLDTMQRLNIMIDVANALEYLHHGYSTTVVHCDLKPSNVLMDENMVAHISDFGITKFLDEKESKIHTRTFATLGYMAPEYGSEGRVSTRADVYSYGIMLLETFTRKQPSDEMFSGDKNLKKWVEDSLPHAVSQVIDARLIRPEESKFGEILCCASSVMELALRCSANYPGERMNMKDVLVELNKIKAGFMLHHPGETGNK